MSSPEQPENTTLRLTRRLAAPRERVFRAWTSPQALQRWWGPAGFSTPSAEIDLRPGGSFRIAMQPPAGPITYLFGTFREVRPPERLVYTWQSDAAGMSPGETLVTVDFLDWGEETEVVLTHELFPSTEVRDAHGFGWNGSLDRLADLVQNDPVAQ